VIVLPDPRGSGQETRTLLADTGAGGMRAGFEIILTPNDCLRFGGSRMQWVRLQGAFTGRFPVYQVRVLIPQLGFDDDVEIAAAATVPPNFDGIAGFRFLNRFTYGNFGDPSQFGLET
jgi:hypothetical protein